MVTMTMMMMWLVMKTIADDDRCLQAILLPGEQPWGILTKYFTMEVLGSLMDDPEFKVAMEDKLNELSEKGISVSLLFSLLSLVFIQVNIFVSLSLSVFLSVCLSVSLSPSLSLSLLLSLSLSLTLSLFLPPSLCLSPFFLPPPPLSLSLSHPPPPPPPEPSFSLLCRVNR